MFQFENQLKGLKHEILKNVAVLAKQDRLNEEELNKIGENINAALNPEYMKTVGEKAKIAAGFVGEEGSSQVIFAVEGACDKCPTKKFYITDACRACVSRKCISACGKKAIVINENDSIGRAVIQQDKCVECGMCKKACPYDAIAMVGRPCKAACPTTACTFNEDASVAIKEEECINCGKCMSECPFGAIQDKSSIGDVVKALVKGEKVYATVAPAISGQFGMKVQYGQIKDAMLKLGFKDMVEAACGADAVTVHESNEFVERMKQGDKYMTNSCCPGFLSYIEIMNPDQKERISSTVSPMIATGRYIKNIDKDAKVVFVGPCTAKKSEALKGSLKDAIDYVITFEELVAILDAFEIYPENCENIEVDDASTLGRGFGVTGGLTAAIKNYVAEKGVQVEFRPVIVSGKDEIKKTMTMAKVGKLDGNFIEGMLCEGGCINGAGISISPMKAKAAFNKQNANATRKSVLANERIEAFHDVNLERH